MDDEPLKKLASVDKLVHEPARLVILTCLLKSGGADFIFLSTVSGLSRGNLTTHLGKLEEGGLIETERVIRRRKPQTIVRLTPQGETEIKAYWEYMGSFDERMDSWQETKLQKSWTDHLKEVYGG